MLTHPTTPSAPRDPHAFSAAFAAAPLAMAVVDREGVVVAANDTMGGLLGGGADRLVGRVAAELVDLASDARTWHAYREVLGGRQARLRCTRRLKHPDGHSLWVQVTVAPLPREPKEPKAPGEFTPSHTASGGLADSDDPAARHRGPGRTGPTTQHANSDGPTAEHANPGGPAAPHAHSNGGPATPDANPNGGKTPHTNLGGPEAPHTNSNGSPATAHANPNGGKTPHTNLGGPATPLSKSNGGPEASHANPNGGTATPHTNPSASATQLENSGGGPAPQQPAPGLPASQPAEPAVLVSIADISARRELQARLRHLQMHDPVTRLPNRTLFFERLSAALEAEAYEENRTGRIGLCYLDLDGFKAINDTLGHRIGDRLLAAVAERLTRCADEAGYARTSTPLVARLGGDEFALLVEDSTGTDQLAELAQSVLKALQAPFELSGQRLSVSASIGVVERHAASTTATGLMQAADTTLYWAKADGKSRWTLFDPERNAHRMTRQALSSTLRPAVDRGEFALEYQPLVDMEDGEVRGVEALVRWNHPQFGTLTPNRFIGLAEEDGSIVQLGRWVLATACRQARRWQLDHPDRAPLFVSVNVAVRQVWDSDLVADVAEILAETGLAPHLLQLELTESAVMGSAGRPLQALQALSDMGVRIAIDDFGTGYSNLAYLSRLPVSVLKLDGAFVRGFQYENHQDAAAPPNPADEVIVEALIQLAHRLGLTVTAECVETSSQASRLRRIGCDTGQGWLYSRPVPPDRIAMLLETVTCPRA